MRTRSTTSSRRAQFGALRMEDGYLCTVERSRTDPDQPLVRFYWGPGLPWGDGALARPIAAPELAHDADARRYLRLFLAAPLLFEATDLSQEAEDHFKDCTDCDEQSGETCAAGIALLDRAEAVRVQALEAATIGAPKVGPIPREVAFRTERAPGVRVVVRGDSTGRPADFYDGADPDADGGV